LAHFVQAVALAAVLSAAAPLQIRAADFSHRDHLGYALVCTRCHVSVTTSTRVEDNNLPQKEACVGCHSEYPIKSPRAMPLAHFSHAQHVKNIDCLKCHTGIDTSTVTTIANFPKMALCVTCHDQSDNPFSCAQCHAKGMTLKPASHAVGFVDSHSRAKRVTEEKAACRVCHGSNFRCAGCH
jgi:predicted CXXCH cytochrome family protein